MRFGHRFTGTIERYDEKGRGVFELTSDKPTVGSGTISVPFSAVGDEVVATFVKRDHGVKIAKLESITSPGPDRVKAPCPHAGVCGGCLWQHLSYDAQLTLKLGMINNAFAAAGHAERVEHVLPCPAVTEQERAKIDEIRSAGASGERGVLKGTSSEPHSEARADRDFRAFFRNRMDYVVGWHSEIGLKEFGQWNRYVDLKTCLLLNDGVSGILQHVRDWMKDNDLQPWDAKFYTGDVRYVVVREGKKTDQRLIVIVIKDLARITESHRADLAERLSPLCTSLLLGEQSLQTDISYAQRFETLHGDPWLEEICNDIRYRIHPNSFFQTNSGMAEELQKAVASFVGTPSTLLDLYCGLGFFGIYLAKNDPSMKVSGFEIDAEAIELARSNASANGVGDRCDFTSGPAEDLSWKDIDADCIILDPPRAGLHPKVIKTVLEKQPKNIVYVSCNYHRLVEELKQFKEHYTIEKLTALDLFPHSPHVEVVVKMRYT